MNFSACACSCIRPDPLRSWGCKNRPQDFFQSGNSVTESTVAIGLWGREQQNRMDQESQKKKEGIPIFEFGHPCCKLLSTESAPGHVSLALSKTLGCKDQSNPMPAFHVTLQHKQSITRLRLFFFFALSSSSSTTTYTLVLSTCNLKSDKSKPRLLAEAKRTYRPSFSVGLC